MLRSLSFRTSLLLLLAAALLFAMLNVMRFGGEYSPDLMALWIAGHFYDVGQYDEIYRVDVGHFTILPPMSWGTICKSLVLKKMPTHMSTHRFGRR